MWQIRLTTRRAERIVKGFDTETDAGKWLEDLYKEGWAAVNGTYVCINDVIQAEIAEIV